MDSISSWIWDLDWKVYWRDAVELHTTESSMSTAFMWSCCLKISSFTCTCIWWHLETVLKRCDPLCSWCVGSSKRYRRSRRHQAKILKRTMMSMIKVSANLWKGNFLTTWYLQSTISSEYSQEDNLFRFKCDTYSLSLIYVSTSKGKLKHVLFGEVAVDLIQNELFKHDKDRWWLPEMCIIFTY